MITKADWQTVNHDLMAEQRRVLGGPPTAEQLLAYTRGELPADAEERMRDLLVCYPDIARTVAVPFPREAAQPADADYLPDAELEKVWPLVQRRLGYARSRGGVLQFPHALTALAAAIALVFAGLYWQAQSKLSGVNEPGVLVDEQVLLPDGRGNGDAGVTLTPSRGATMLIVPATPEATSLALVEKTARGERPLWSGEAVRRADDTFAVVVPRGFLAPGDYRLIVYAGTERLSSYSVRVEGAGE
jgi:hypothetical protein